MALIDFGGVTEEVITRKEFPMSKAEVASVPPPSYVLIVGVVWYPIKKLYKWIRRSDKQ